MTERQEDQALADRLRAENLARANGNTLLPDFYVGEWPNATPYRLVIERLVPVNADAMRDEFAALNASADRALCRWLVNTLGNDGG